MAIVFSDTEIQSLIEEHKPVPSDRRLSTPLRPKRGHQEGHISLKGEAGNEFRIILRQSLVIPLDFSLILATYAPYSNKVFRLRRYNGKSHRHTNAIEKDKFYNFHIHFATERYQRLETGREDGYAEETDRYADYIGALRCFIDDLNIEFHHKEQIELFPEV